MTRQQARSWVPFLGLLALVVLFLSLPAIPKVLPSFGCPTCSPGKPYLALAGTGYFAVLIAVSLLFPTLPGPQVARSGLTWAVLLALALTYLKWPDWCLACQIGHACNVLIWAIWLAAPAPANAPAGTLAFKERLFLTLFAPLAVVALFSSLNLTLLVYNFKSPTAPTAGLQAGEPVPPFSTQTSTGRSLSSDDLGQNAALVINFVSPDCPYCNEQLPVLNGLAAERASGPYRFVNVSAALPSELVQRSPRIEWVEDRDAKLRELFQVSGFPTLFVVGSDGKIAQVFAGTPDRLKASLGDSLDKLAGARDAQHP